jgi:hypothetical protein
VGVSDLNAQTDGTIIAPDGTVASRPTLILSDAEADLLRRYKKFLNAHGIREAWFCNTCWSGDREDGMRAFVTDGQIVAECRCRMLFYQGQSY